MKNKPIKYRNICLVQWCALVLAQIVYQCTDYGVFEIIRALLMLCVVISILNYKTVFDRYINKGDYKKITKIQTENGCYKAVRPIEQINGIIISCTDEDEPFLKRYVDYHVELGFNNEKNHWNIKSNIKMPHEFIGYDKQEQLVIVNTLPYSISSLNCGKGKNGSCDMSYLKITICFKSDDKTYFENAVLGAAVQHCAYLCKKHKLKPQSIFSDKEAFEFGFAENYTQVEQWMAEHGSSMDDFRKSVKDRLKGK